MSRSTGSMMTFNINDGYLEGILRGYRLGLLGEKEHYANLVQCESLEDMKLQLQETDYGNFLENEPSPLQTTTIAEKCTEKMVEQFNYLRANAVEPLATFLDYISYAYMIDNVVLLITGTLHDRDPEELKEKCHPLGRFESMGSITVEDTTEKLYKEVLIDTPLGPYIAGCLKKEDLDEKHIEEIRNTLYKAYLEDFDRFCKRLGGETYSVMHRVLGFEADRRSVNITLNSFGTELEKDSVVVLYPRLGKLYPEGVKSLERAEDEDQVQASLAHIPEYHNLFNQIQYDEDKSLEDAFFEYEVKLHELSFFQQFGYGVFYSYFRLKEQEIRNIVWIAECIQQDQRDKIGHYVPIFE